MKQETKLGVIFSLIIIIIVLQIITLFKGISLYKDKQDPKIEIKEIIKEESAIPYWDREENQDELKRIGLEYEANKAKWLAENPPVKELFNEDKIYDTDYVIQYLKENKIGGHCALVWRADVVCVDTGSIRFPTNRESIY